MDILRKRGPQIIDFVNLYHKQNKRHWSDFFYFRKKQKKERRYYRYLKYASVFILILISFLIVFIAFNAFTIKKIYDSGMSAKNEIQTSIDLAKQQNFKEAVVYSQNAANHFNSALNGIKDLRSSFSFLPYLGTQLEEVEKLLSSAAVIANVVSEGELFALHNKELLSGQKQLSYSEFSREEKRKILDYFGNSGPELSGMKSNLDLALYNLDSVNTEGMLRPFKEKIVDVKDKVATINDLLTRAIPLTQVLPTILGYPEESYFLVLFQNKDELRPTGGFIGNYGIVQIDSAEIARFDTHDVYHLDMPVKDKINITPPEPIKEYLVDKWYMRDANWSPDWTESAQVIESFYYQENALLTGKDKINFYDGKFTGVVGITPDFITSLLKITGPITLEGQTYTSENFSELLEYRVEMKYKEVGESNWNRKNIIGDICKELKIKLLDLPTDRWQEIFNILEENLLRKNIIVYLNSPALQEIIGKEGWTGEIKKEPGDYLMVIDSNMGALKTDSVISRSIDYQLNSKGNTLNADLRLNYSHNGGALWRTTKYRSYVRVYVPQGSKLTNTSGDIKSKITVGSDLGKTFFGFLIEVEPGAIASINLEYELPESIKQLANVEGYRLWIQKQPGSTVNNLKVEIDLNKKISSFSPTGLYASKTSQNSVIWDDGLETDKLFKLFF